MMNIAILYTLTTAQGTPHKKAIIVRTEEEVANILEIASKADGIEIEEVIKPDGGNMHYAEFYCWTGGGPVVPRVLEYARLVYPNLAPLSDKEIEEKYMYWGSEYGFHAMYNGDTWVVFDNINNLPQDMRLDAYNNTKQEVI